MRAHLPDRQVRRRPSRQAAPPASAPVRGDPEGSGGPLVRADDGHRLRQEPRLDRADRGPRAAARVRARHPGHRRLPDERAGQQPERGAREVHRPGLPGRPVPRSVRALHRAGKGAGAGRHTGQPAGHPAHELHDAGAAAHAHRGPRAGAGRAGSPVPGVRRAAHLPGASGRRHRDAHPPLPARLRQRRHLRRHLRHDGERRRQRSAAARSGEGVPVPVRGGLRAGAGRRRDAGTRDPGDRSRGPRGSGRHSRRRRVRGWTALGSWRCRIGWRIALRSRCRRFR